MIRGTQVLLRPTREQDLDTLYALQSDTAERTPLAPVGFSSFVQFRKDFDQAGWWFDDGGGLVITSRDDTIIGTIGCRRNGIIAGYEVGYQIFRRADRGKGFMGEALALFSHHMFDWKDIPRLYLLIDPDNTASVAVATKTGYRLEGTMRRAVFARGRYRDLSIYALLREGAPLPEPAES